MGRVRFAILVGVAVVAMWSISLVRSAPAPAPATAPAGAPSLAPAVPLTSSPRRTPAPAPAAAPVAGSLAVRGDFRGVDGTAPFWDGPPWPSILATATRIVLGTSDRVELRDREGALVEAATLSSFYAPVAVPGSEIRNPYMIRDPETGRILAVVAVKATRGSPRGDIALAVSRSADPSSFGVGDWSFHSFTWTVSSDRNIFEVPRVATGRRSIVITAQSDPGDGRPSVGTTLVLDKHTLVDKGVVQRADLEPVAGAFFNPVRASDPIDPVYLLTRDPAPGSCGVVVWRIDADGRSVTRSSRTLAGERGCAAASDIPQGDGARPIDVAFERARIDAVSDGASIWNVRTLASTGTTTAAVRWTQIDVSGWPDRLRFVQEGWIRGEDGGYAYPAIVAGDGGRVAIVAIRVARADPASLVYTGRLGTDAANTLRPLGTLRAGTGAVACADHASATSSGGIRADFRDRFAGQSGAAIDPTDGTVWLVGAYASEQNAGCDFSTWVGHLDWSVVPLAASVPGTTVRIGFEGAPSAGVPGSHPDHAIAVGPASLLAVGNSVVTLLHRDGRRLATAPTSTFFPLPQGVRIGGDPWMTYDTSSGRFFYVTDAAAGDGHVTKCVPGECRSYQMIAVSRSSEPRSLSADDWYFHAIDRTVLRLPGGPVATAAWGDFDHIAVHGNTVVITWAAAAFGIGSGDPGQVLGARARILDKGGLIRGETVTDWTDLELTGPDGAMVDRAEATEGSGGSAPLFFVGLRGCDVLVWAVASTPAGAVTLQRQVVPARACAGTGALGAAQPAGASPIFIMSAGRSALYRDGSLWSAHLIRRDLPGGPVSAVRWFQIDVSTWPAQARFVQDGVIAVDGVFQLAPALAVDRSGNAFVVFGRTGRTEYPSMYYAFRASTDPPNTMRDAVRLRSGSAGWSTSNTLLGGRNGWVDFFATAPDPRDESQWLFGAYVDPQGQRATWIVNVSTP